MNGFVLSEGVLKAMHCPFLTRIPIGQVRQHATELLQMADHCPIMGHVMKYSSLSSSDTAPSKGQFNPFHSEYIIRDRFTSHDLEQPSAIHFYP